jgi:hypothetical protein
VGRYLWDRSLWLDEGMISLNIVGRGWSGLFGALDRNQGAPAGFLAIEKLAVTLFGNNEYALRLYPLIASVLAVVLLVVFTRGLLSPWIRVVTVAAFATSARLIHYSDQAKQYSSDVMFVLIALIAIRWWRRQPNLRRSLMVASIGTIAVWFSHPIIFVLAGAGLLLVIESLRRREYRNAAARGAIAGAWAVSFLANYLLLQRNLTHSSMLLSAWKQHFLSLHPHNVNDAFAYVTKFAGGLNFVMPFQPHGVGEFLGSVYSCTVITAALIGAVMLWRAKHRKLLALLLAPVPFLTIAAALHKYPYGDRMILFLAPLYAILIGAAGGWMLDQQPSRLRFAGAALSLALLVPPSLMMLYNMSHRPVIEEMRPLLAQLQPRIKDRDVVLLNSWAEPTFDYYVTQSRRFNLGKVDIERGTLDADDAGEDIYQRREMPQSLASTLRDRVPPGRNRVWVVLSHNVPAARETAEHALAEFNKLGGKRTWEAHTTGVSAYLYDFSQQPIFGMKVADSNALSQ